ncbi:MAG: hypothetical protein QF680_03285 [Acidobacteriota bacterium]|nr:hypothetical protein [Acidobacteriota bacterium]
MPINTGARSRSADRSTAGHFTQKRPFEPIKTNGAHENGTIRAGHYDPLYDSGEWRDRCPCAGEDWRQQL